MNYIESYSSQIFSNDKHTRRFARDYLIQHKDRFLKTKLDIATWVGDALEKKTFPFFINQNKAGVIYQSFPLDQPQTENTPEDTDKIIPAYVAMLAHAIPGDKKLKKIEYQLTLLREESFKTTSEESIEEASKRLRIVAGVNWPYSLDDQVNKACKKYLQTLQPFCSPTCHFEMFTWSPIWLNANGDKVDVKKPKRLFRLISEIDRAASLEILNKLMSTKVIPMQSIREEIKNSKYLASHAISLRRGVKHRPVFLVCLDDDAVHLKTNELGLFSHYDKIIAEHPSVRVATTGYIMLDPENEYVELASRSDLAGRRALGSCAYFPEPNFIVRFDFLLQRTLFKRKGRGDRLEYLAVVENLHLYFQDLVFGKHGPIVTASNRVVVPKHMPAKLTRAHLLKSKNLASFRAFMQSSLNPIYGFSASVGRLYPGCGEQALKKYYSAIFTSLCPIECSKTFNNWPVVYRELRAKIITFHDKKVVNPKVYMQVNDKNAIDAYCEKKFTALWTARKELLKSGKITLDGYAIIYQKAKDVTDALFNFLEENVQSIQ